jgi:hypothetical protein
VIDEKRRGQGRGGRGLGKWLFLAGLSLFDAHSSQAVDGRGPGATLLAPAVRTSGASLNVLRVPTINSVQTGVLVIDGRPFRIVERETPFECDSGVHINSRHEPLEHLLSTACQVGPRCLAFEGRVAPRGCGPDRIEVDLASDEHSLRFGETGHLRFLLRVDPTVDVTEHVLISQAWQFASVAIGSRPTLGPAFSIALSNDPHDPDRVLLQFRYRNVVVARDQPNLFFEYPVKKGEWHNLHCALTPRYVGHPSGPGAILIWIDQGPTEERDPTRARNFRARDVSGHRFYWGYPPDPSTRLEERFEVRVGIYRPEPFTSVKFWMDDVELTRTAADLAGL